MNKKPWYAAARDHWHLVAYTLLLWVTIVVYALHFISPRFGTLLEPLLAPTNLLIIILMFVALIAAELRRDKEQLQLDLASLRNAMVTSSDVTAALKAEIIPLANVRFFSTKEETLRKFIAMTTKAHQVLMATRFSPGDVTLEQDYWKAVRERALDPTLMVIRIHSLAHHTGRPLDTAFKLIDQFKGARQFALGIALFSNAFEMLIADDEEAMLSFHDFEMTIRNGVHFDSSLPSSRAIVQSFGDTFRRMLDRCCLVVAFDEFVRTEQDVERLKAFLRKTHQDYCRGTLLRRPPDMEDFLRNRVSAQNTGTSEGFGASNLPMQPTGSAGD